MDFGLSEDQQLLVESFSNMLEKISTTEVVRDAEPLGYDEGVWEAVRSNGVVEMAVAEAAGGWGASMLDLVLVSECFGRRCLPAPAVEAQVAARLLSRCATDVAAVTLDDVLTNGRLVTLAVHGTKNGVASLVPAAAVADAAVLSGGDGVVLAGRSAIGEPRSNHGHLPLADVSLRDDAELLTVDAGLLGAAVDEWLLLTASSLVGLAAGALELAVEYAKERRAFGAPIGSFQGIAHRLADAATLIDGARLLVREAAWSNDEQHVEAGERAALAFAFATDAAKYSTYWAVHTYGGYGVMLEYDVNLFFQRARGWAGVFGDADAAYLRAADRRYERSQ